MSPKIRTAKLAIAVALAALASIVTFSFAQQAPKHGPHFSFAHKRAAFKEENVVPEVVVSGVDSEGILSLIDEIWNPKFATSPHFHKIHAETFYIIAGKVEWNVGGETKVLGPGDCVHIPVYTAHSAKVVGESDLHTVMIYQPGGFEAQMDLEASLMPDQRKDPKIREQLTKMADVYPIVAGNALADAAQKPTKVTQYFSFAATRPTYKDDGTSDVALSSVDSGGRLNLQDEVWEPSLTVGPHFHKIHTETFYVISGRVEWTVGGETHILSSGDGVHIPANTVHSAKNLDGKPLHTLLLYQPFGYDSHLELQNSYSAEQLKDPAVRKTIRMLNDFNPVVK